MTPGAFGLLLVPRISTNFVCRERYAQLKHRVKGGGPLWGGPGEGKGSKRASPWSRAPRGAPGAPAMGWKI
jgi:hypothetical protein